MAGVEPLRKFAFAFPSPASHDTIQMVRRKPSANGNEGAVA